MVIVIASMLARLVLVAIFALAGFAKLADADKTREMLAEFGVRREALTIAAVGLPLTELAVAAALVIPPTAFIGAIAGTTLLMLFTGVILFNLSRGRHPSCNCFGQMGAAPIGRSTLIRNGVLTLLALLVVAAGPDAAATWRLDQVFGVSPLMALVGVGAVMAILLLMLIAVTQMVILRRLGAGPAHAVMEARSPTSPMDSRGLPDGSLAPSFGLSDTEGGFVTLEQLLAPGRPVILYFMKHDCPPCAAMAAEVDRWQRHYAGVVEVVRVTDGLATTDHYALLQPRGAVAEAYDCWGTPCAVLVTSEGRIGGPVAQGAAAIRALVKRAAASTMAGAAKLA